MKKNWRPFFWFYPTEKGLKFQSTVWFVNSEERTFYIFHHIFKDHMKVWLENHVKQCIGNIGGLVVEEDHQSTVQSAFPKLRDAPQFWKTTKGPKTAHSKVKIRSPVPKKYL